MNWINKLLDKKTSSSPEETGNNRTVDHLIKELQKDHTRDQTIHSLVQLGAEAVGPLIAALKDENAKVHEAAFSALAQIGADAVAPLITTLESGDIIVRARAAKLLGQIRDIRAVKPLIAAIKAGLPRGETPPGVHEFDYSSYLFMNEMLLRRESATALQGFGAEVVEPLIEALKDLGKDTRWYAAKVLGDIGDERAIEPLVAAKDTALAEKDIMTRQTATDALVKLGWWPTPKQ